MLLARPSDRARLTLRRVYRRGDHCLTGATSAILRMRATYRLPNGVAVPMPWRSSIACSQSRRPALLSLGYTLWPYCPLVLEVHPGRSDVVVVPPNAGGYTVNEVPQMHAALSSIWLSVRVASFCTGLPPSGSMHCASASVPHVRHLQGRGFYIDALVGIVLTPSAGLRRQRLRLQLSRLKQREGSRNLAAAAAQPAAAAPLPSVQLHSHRQASSTWPNYPPPQHPRFARLHGHHHLHDTILLGSHRSVTGGIICSSPSPRQPSEACTCSKRSGVAQRPWSLLGCIRRRASASESRCSSPPRASNARCLAAWLQRCASRRAFTTSMSVRHSASRWSRTLPLPQTRAQSLLWRWSKVGHRDATQLKCPQPAPLSLQLSPRPQAGHLGRRW